MFHPIRLAIVCMVMATAACSFESTCVRTCVLCYDTVDEGSSASSPSHAPGPAAWSTAVGVAY